MTAVWTRPGFQDIRVTFDIDADAPRERVEQLIELVRERSVVFDTVSRPVSVSLGLAS